MPPYARGCCVRRSKVRGPSSRGSTAAPDGRARAAARAVRSRAGGSARSPSGLGTAGPAPRHPAGDANRTTYWCPELPGVGATRLRRVGHKGAEHIAPGNTYESFDAALATGVDMIEFDVLPDLEGTRLLLAHDYDDAASRAPHSLEEGLAHLATDAFGAIELDVDLKLPGYELRVLDALRDHGLLGRSMISTQYGSSLSAVRAAEPAVKLGWSVPRVRRDPFRSPALSLPARVAVHLARRALPSRAAAAIRARRCDALMVHWRLVSARLVERVLSAGGELYVWTVDDLAQLRALEDLGVTGVISNDPRLFAQL